MHVGYTVPGVVTGKPISLGGSEGRNEATARGCVYCVVEAAKHLGLDLHEAPRWPSRASATPGSIAAQLMARRGLHGRRRLRLAGRHPQPGRPRHRAASSPGSRSTAPSSGSPARRTITNGELLELPCDVLIPAASRTRSPPRNAEQHQGQDRRRGRQRPDDARGRRDPVRRSGVFMIPDILCNAGGVTVSYFEWVQDLNRDHWSEDDRQRQAQGDHGPRRSARSLAMRRTATRSTCGPAAYLLAVDRVADSHRPARPVPVDRLTDPRIANRRRHRSARGSAGPGRDASPRRFRRRGPAGATIGRDARPRREVPVQGGDPPPRDALAEPGGPRQRRGPAHRRHHQPALRFGGLHPRAVAPGHARRRAPARRSSGC